MRVLLGQSWVFTWGFWCLTKFPQSPGFSCCWSASLGFTELQAICPSHCWTHDPWTISLLLHGKNLTPTIRQGKSLSCLARHLHGSEGWQAPTSWASLQRLGEEPGRKSPGTQRPRSYSCPLCSQHYRGDEGNKQQRLQTRGVAIFDSGFLIATGKITKSSLNSLQSSETLALKIPFFYAASLSDFMQDYDRFRLSLPPLHDKLEFTPETI